MQMTQTVAVSWTVSLYGSNDFFKTVQLSDRPFPDIACCHGSHHFHTIGSIVAGKKPAPAGVLASDVDLSLWYLQFVRSFLS